MDKTILNIKTDKELKAKAQKVAKEMGLPLSTILNAYLRQLIDERRVVFSAPLMPKPKLAKQLRRALRDIRQGKNMSGPFETAEEMDAHLDALK